MVNGTLTAEHPWIEINDPLVEAQRCINLKPWIITFDGSHTQKGVGVGVTIICPSGKTWKFMCQLKAGLSNNQAEYEALILGLRVLVTMKAKYTQVMGDSQMMMKQLTEEYSAQILT